jgi:hypothetical protein
MSKGIKEDELFEYNYSGWTWFNYTDCTDFCVYYKGQLVYNTLSTSSEYFKIAELRL